jgi:hypothetical protein
MGRQLPTTAVFAACLLLAGGCTRPRILGELRRDERLHRQRELLSQQLAELEQRNEVLAYEIEYMDRRQDAVRREAAWWKTYGREDLGRCIEIVTQLVDRVEGQLKGLYSAYYGAACRKRSAVEEESAILIADEGHSIDTQTRITGGMTYIAGPTQFSFVILRPYGNNPAKRLYRVAWTTPSIPTRGGSEKEWHFLESFQAQAGDVPAIVFPDKSGIYVDRLAQTTGRGIGRVCLLPRRGVPEPGTLVQLPAPRQNVQYSFGLMGVPVKE